MKRYFPKAIFGVIALVSFLLVMCFSSVSFAQDKDLDQRILEKHKEFENKARNQQKRIVQKKEKIKKDFDKRLEKLYNQGVGLYKKEFFWQAKEVFEDVDSLLPGYKGTKSYLAKIGKRIKKQSGKRKNIKREREETSREEIISNVLDDLGYGF